MNEQTDQRQVKRNGKQRIRIVIEVDVFLGSESVMVSKGGKIDYRSGGKVDAKSSSEKAVKPGDDYKNDKVKALLSEGEIVIPRSVTQSKDPIRNSAEFVRKALMKRGK